MLTIRMRILLCLLGTALIAAGITGPREWATIPRPAAVTDNRPLHGRPLELADKEISLPPGLIGKDVIIVVDAKTDKVTHIREVTKIGDDGRQTVELPPGTRFGGIGWRYSHGIPDLYWPAETRYEVSLMPRDPTAKPRTYIITIKEN